ncbi:RNA polymerase factor sigma-54 [Allopusillimonas ginsengisoli]|uniref:RNA polymerase factor sigma-54 n=1 Tax=Allopusillimonas ginsengisoli TaxID=453575 RepID=UPI00101ED28F|nr:RNA polymerase factor sigma-54 [Allopusillimonas ginsengisoli]TEA77113.1 RNA polymerase factor sigma-54 [Allopusillimonas ginsengisoli]
MIQLVYELQARQQTTLTPRLQQSVRLLQMSTLDFKREVAEALASNPFLEDQEEGGAGQDSASGADNAKLDVEGSHDAYAHAGDLHEPDRDAAATNGMGDADSYDEAPEIQRIASAPVESRAYSGDYPATRQNSERNTDVGQWARAETSLQDALYANLCGFSLSERDKCLAFFIIEAIDDDGYLREPLTELADPAQFSPAPTQAEWEVALRLVQHLGAPGIAARDLSECLALQIEAMPEDTPARAVALRIVKDQLERLGRCDYQGMAKATLCSVEDARTASLLIRTLTPRPGRRYGAVDPSSYVIPDAYVRKVGKLWIATANNEAIPQAQINDAYARLFRKTRYDERAMMAQALQEARWLIRSLEQRTQTIQRVAQAIVARQQTFFDYGEVALRPLMLSEIAEELDMHESTVSRATSSKYLATPRGIYEFKHFFTRELATKSGGSCSAGAVRALIQEMIDDENPKEPLSDVTLADKLAQEGIMVARRTVSKYRAQIKYPPAELRRAP